MTLIPALGFRRSYMVGFISKKVRKREVPIGTGGFQYGVRSDSPANVNCNCKYVGLDPVQRRFIISTKKNSDIQPNGMSSQFVQPSMQPISGQIPYLQIKCFTCTGVDNGKRVC